MAIFKLHQKFTQRFVVRELENGECVILDRKHGEIIRRPQNGEHERYPKTWAAERCKQLNGRRRQD